MTSFPKSPRKQNPALLNLARGKPCIMQITPDCYGVDGSTTVAAHSNELRHGKGRGLKSHDHYSVWACANCHRWYDEGKASKAGKQAAFGAAMHDQVREWVKIAAGGNAKNAKSAQWALDELGVIAALLSEVSA